MSFEWYETVKKAYKRSVQITQIIFIFYKNNKLNIRYKTSIVGTHD